MSDVLHILNSISALRVHELSSLNKSLWDRLGGMPPAGHVAAGAGPGPRPLVGGAAKELPR